MAQVWLKFMTLRFKVQDKYVHFNFSRFPLSEYSHAETSVCGERKKNIADNMYLQKPGSATLKAHVPRGSPLCGGDVTVYVWHKPAEIAHSVYSVLVFISILMALLTVFHSMNSLDNSPFFHSVLSVLSLPYWSFQLYIYLWKFPSALI